VEDGVGVAVGVCVPVELLEKDTLAELDGDAPIVSDPVGDTEMVELSLRVVEGVKEPVPVPVPVNVPVGEGVGVTVAERLLERELLGVFEGGAPKLIDGDGDTVGVPVGESVRDDDVERDVEAATVVEKVGVEVVVGVS